MFTISVKSNLAKIRKKLSAVAYKELPFVEARTVTELAKLAQAAEKVALPNIFDRPTPFTVNSVAVQAARKGLPVARVYIRDIAARYLQPYENGGMHYMGGSQTNLLTPVQARTNKYGNLPRNFLANQRGKTSVFVGKLKLSGKDINGMWQRTPKGLKLLVAFDANKPVTKRLNFGDRAKAAVEKNINRVFDQEMAKALLRVRALP